MASKSVMYTGDAESREASNKLPISEISAILLLVGLFLVAMTPLTLLPLMLRDSQGRRRVGWKTAIATLAAGVATLTSVLAAMKWDQVAPYAKFALVGTQNTFTVAKQLPGDIVKWLDSGAGLRFFLKALFFFTFFALFFSWLLPKWEGGVHNLKARLSGKDIQAEPRSVNIEWVMKKEDMAGLRQRQQEELEKNAQEKKEVLRQRRLAHTTEHEQRFQNVNPMREDGLCSAFRLYNKN